MPPMPAPLTPKAAVGVLVRIAVAWLVLGLGIGVIAAEVKGGDLGSFVFLVWGGAVAMSGGVAHCLLALAPAFRRLIALLQVIAITVLALVPLFLYSLLDGGATFGPRGSGTLLVQSLPYLLPSLFVLATIVNAMFTPTRDA